ncbi:DNA-directed DNA polymerase [Balamuthia mandrillaris]
MRRRGKEEPFSPSALTPSLSPVAPPPPPSKHVNIPSGVFHGYHHHHDRAEDEDDEYLQLAAALLAEKTSTKSKEEDQGEGEGEDWLLALLSSKEVEDKVQQLQLQQPPPPLLAATPSTAESGGNPTKPQRRKRRLRSLRSSGGGRGHSCSSSSFSQHQKLCLYVHSSVEVVGRGQTAEEAERCYGCWSWLALEETRLGALAFDYGLLRPYRTKEEAAAEEKAEEEEERSLCLRATSLFACEQALLWAKHHSVKRTFLFLSDQSAFSLLQQQQRNPSSQHQRHLLHHVQLLLSRVQELLRQVNGQTFFLPATDIPLCAELSTVAFHKRNNPKTAIYTLSPSSPLHSPSPPSSLCIPKVDDLSLHLAAAAVAEFAFTDDLFLPPSLEQQKQQPTSSSVVQQIQPFLPSTSSSSFTFIADPSVLLHPPQKRMFEEMEDIESTTLRKQLSSQYPHHQQQQQQQSYSHHSFAPAQKVELNSERSTFPPPHVPPPLQPPPQPPPFTSSSLLSDDNKPRLTATLPTKTMSPPSVTSFPSFPDILPPLPLKTVSPSSDESVTEQPCPFTQAIDTTTPSSSLSPLDKLSWRHYCRQLTDLPPLFASSSTSVDYSKAKLVKEEPICYEVTCSHVVFEAFVAEWKEQPSWAWSLLCSRMTLLALKWQSYAYNFLPNVHTIDGICVCWNDREVYYIALSDNSRNKSANHKSNSNSQSPIKENLVGAINVKDVSSSSSSSASPKDQHQPFAGIALTNCYPSSPPLNQRFGLLKQLLEASDSEKVLFFMKPQLKILLAYAIQVKGALADPKIGCWVLDPDLNKERSLHDLLETYVWSSFAQTNINFQKALLASSSASAATTTSTSSSRGLGSRFFWGQNNLLPSVTPITPLSISDCISMAYGSWALMKAIKPLLELDKAQNDLFKQVEMPLLPILAKMEYRGIGFDAASLSLHKNQINEKLKFLETEAHRLIDEHRQKRNAARGQPSMLPPPSISSSSSSSRQRPLSLENPSDVAEMLFDILQLPYPGEQFSKSKKQQFPKSSKRKLAQKKKSTASDILFQLQPLHRLPSIVLEHRKLSHLKHTYIEALPPFAFEDTRFNGMHRIYSTILQTAAATGRLAFTDPNLQSIAHDVRFLPLSSASSSSSASASYQQQKQQTRESKSYHLHPSPNEAENENDSFVLQMDLNEREALTVSIRNAFIAASDHVLLSVDYAQLELRLMAHFSEDSVLLPILKRKGSDLFRSLAARWLDKTEESQVTFEERNRAKHIIYGIIYGRGAASLAVELSVTKEEAAEFIRSFQGKFVGVFQFVQKTLMRCRRLGFVRTLLGRKRFLPQINSEDYHVRSAAERQAVNTICQGSAADLVKVAMIKVQRRLKQLGYGNTVHVLVQLHDELLLEVPSSQFDAVKREVVHVMESAVKLSVPLPTNAKYGQRWGSLLSCPTEEQRGEERNT